MFFLAQIEFEHPVLVKPNSLFRFLEEFTAWQFAFEINWPLAVQQYLSVSDELKIEK